MPICHSAFRKAKKQKPLIRFLLFVGLAFAAGAGLYRQSRTDLRNDPDLAHGGP